MAAAVLGILVVRIGLALAGGLLLAVAAAFAIRPRHWLPLAERSPVGARSEDQVRRVLAPLQEYGWRLRLALPWRGHGDIDSVVIAPNGVGFVIETKTKTYDVWFVPRESSATSGVCWWSRSTGSLPCCGVSRSTSSAVGRRG